MTFRPLHDRAPVRDERSIMKDNEIIGIVC